MYVLFPIKPINTFDLGENSFDGNINVNMVDEFFVVGDLDNHIKRENDNFDLVNNDVEDFY